MFSNKVQKTIQCNSRLRPKPSAYKQFFAHWIKEIDVTKYGTNKSLIPTTTPQEVYRYSDAMLKHLPKNAPKMIQKDLLFSKKAVIYPANSNRRSHNNDDATKRTDDNIEDKEDKFAVQIDSKYVYRIPLHARNRNKKIILIEGKVTVIGAPDAQIVFLKAPFIQYEKILLTKNFVVKSFEDGYTKNIVSKNLRASDEITRIHGRLQGLQETI